MEVFSPIRLVHEGHNPSDTWRITKIGHSKLNVENIRMATIETLAEYESGCQEHEKCLGHLCKTPHGMILPMQSLCVSTPVVKNDVCKAARAAFGGSSQYNVSQHQTILSDSMKRKTGRMRKGILNCHVDGSLRMVISPQTVLPFNVVTIPHYLSDVWKVVYLDETTHKYKERYVKEGDWAIAIRPPSLSIKSVQPVKIAFWNETCMGISPDILAAFSGDYDGDEMHLYPVYSENALLECENWHGTPNTKFEKARELYRNSNIPDKRNDPYAFMYHTTMSFEEIRNGAEQPLFAQETRTQKEHLSEFMKRYDIGFINSTFLQETIRGMADTNAQQLSQPIVGDMSRIAKLAASCVVHNEDGMIGIAAETQFIPIINSKFDEQDGNASMRGVSTICSGLQQILLQAHHAKKSALPSHDIVSGMIKGSSDMDSDSKKGGPLTLVLLSVLLTEVQIKRSVKPVWQDRQQDAVYVLCRPGKLKQLPQGHILGAYNPQVLSLVNEKRRLAVCVNGFDKTARYYSFELSEIEVLSLAVLFTFKCDSSIHPITTRDGIEARGLRWTETMMATHYSGLVTKVKQKNIEMTSLDTVSACLMAANFLYKQ